MKTINYEDKIPSISIIKDSEFMQTNYEDSISIEIPANTTYSIDYLTIAFFSSFTAWILALIRLRNFIVRPLGLKTGKDFNFKVVKTNKRYEPGDKAVAFHVIKRNENELVMAENDKHLNFRTSVLLTSQGENKPLRLYSITIVKYNNLLGKLYFLLVKPFHKIIVKTSLKLLANNLKK